MPRKKKIEDQNEGSEEIGHGETIISEKEEVKLEKLDMSSLRKDDKKILDAIEKLSKEGLTKAKIGMVLRDSYGVPKSKFIGKKIGKALKERGIGSNIPEDLSNLINHSDNLKKHLEKNKQDKSANRGLQLAEAKIKKLSSYYKKRRIIPETFKR